jgi:two-component system, OmpR family, phosphate regulon sensor histidine kinase PhoR
MRSVIIRWITLISVLVVAALITIQLVWLKRIYRLEENQFNSNVFKSIKGLYEDLDILIDPTVPLQKFVEKPSDNAYLAKVDCLPYQDSVAFFLGRELQDFDLLTDCNLAIYAADSGGRYVYQQYLPAAVSANPVYSNASVPVFQRNYPYILLQFPHRTRYIIREMGFWIGSSVLLLLVLAGFAISMLYLYRQKFLNEIQNDFVNNFTHEFRTPLAVMKIAGEVLQQKDIAEKPAKLQQYSGIITEQTTHLQNQVERLLTHATGKQQNLALQKEDLPVQELITSAVTQLAPLIKERNANIILEPATAQPLINGDRQYLQLVLVNLIENAIKYSAQPRITITSFVKGRYAGISVRDNGPGIAKAYQKHVFKRFYRVPTGNVHDVKGFGLGLNFAKKVVESHNGKIQLKSSAGSGAEFTVLLPQHS